MHIQGGGVIPTQVVSSTEITEKLQDFTLDGSILQFPLKWLLCSLNLGYNINYKKNYGSGSEVKNILYIPWSSSHSGWAFIAT
jgi:hypothetical protein